MRNNLYQQQLFARLLKSPELKKERQLLRDGFGQVKLWLLEPGKINNLSGQNKSLLCQLARGKKAKQHRLCFQRNMDASLKAGREKEFICPSGRFGLCLPLIQGNALYGFLILCNLKHPLSPQSRQLFNAFNKIVLEKIQKELELSKLYRTIRPRAIALSTIHTIHRLISSSLNLDELLPRIARLSLQILRARQCLISLEQNTAQQSPILTFIDNSKTSPQARPSRKMRNIARRITKTGNNLLRRDCLALPLVDQEPIGAICVLGKINNRSFDQFDREILSALTEQAVGAIKNAQLYKEQEGMLWGTVKSLSSLLKAKFPYPCKHSPAFEEIALGIAENIHLAQEDLRDLRYAIMLHDAEKIGLPEEILKKPAHLTNKEIKILKEQPKKGVKIFTPLTRLSGAVQIILHHHEKFDGSGYPDRLKKEAIPIGARIMAIVDSFEAMISSRPYRKTSSVEGAIKEIQRQSGKQFDPEVIKAFLKFTNDKKFRRLIRGFNHGRCKDKQDS